MEKRSIRRPFRPRLIVAPRAAAVCWLCRPRLIHNIRSTNVVVLDLSLKDSAFWNLQLTYCDGVEVRNLTVRAPNAPVKAASSDGIDVDSSRNVLIAGCDIECDDDAIC